MTNNPFSSQVFLRVWSTSFGKKREEIKGLKGVDFYQKTPGFYTNIGRNHTKGLWYSMESDVQLHGKTCLIYDVPTYFKCPSTASTSIVKLLKIPQYPGFLIELHKFSDFNDYLTHKFKKSSRYKLNKYQKRLQQCFAIEANMHTGQIPRDQYDALFAKFRELLEKRFQDKGERNNNLDPSEWNFYKTVTYPMLQQNRAGLFVVYNQKEPISITLTYFGDDIIFDAITVFDTDYSKFHLGSITIMMLIAWGIDNRFKTLDFSKGYFDYKVRWATQHYDFEYHVLYDPKSLISRLQAFGIASFFHLKQYLREKNLNLYWNKLRFLLQKKEGRASTEMKRKGRQIVFEDSEIQDYSDLVKIDGYHPQVIKLFFEFLYLNNENAHEVTVFQISKEHYLFRGENSEKIGYLN